MSDTSKITYESQRIFKNIRQLTFEKTLEVIYSCAKRAMEYMKYNKYYRDVTGNALTSTSIGIFYKGRIVKELHGSDTNLPPTRESLAKGEAYDEGEYYDGEDAFQDDEGNPKKPFVGKYGKGGQWGPTLGKYYIHRFHPLKRNTWTVVVAIPVSYAEHNKKIVRTMQDIMDEVENNMRRGNFAQTEVLHGREHVLLPFEKGKIEGEPDFSKL